MSSGPSTSRPPAPTLVVTTASFAGSYWLHAAPTAPRTMAMGIVVNRRNTSLQPMLVIFERSLNKPME